MVIENIVNGSSNRSYSASITGMNQFGRMYLNGRPLSESIRRQIVELAENGCKACEISRRLCVSNGCVSKILTRYYQTGSIAPRATGGSKPRITTDSVRAHIAALKRQNPIIFAWEIRDQLASENICSPDNLPSISSINRVLRDLPSSTDPETQAPPNVTIHNDGENAIGQTPNWYSRTYGATLPIQLPPSSSIAAPEQDPVATPEFCSEFENSSDCSRESTSSANKCKSKNVKTPRTRTTNEQLALLETEFRNNNYLNILSKEKLRRGTGLSLVQIQTWFSNRRAKQRREYKLQRTMLKDMLQSSSPASTTTSSTASPHTFPTMYGQMASMANSYCGANGIGQAFANMTNNFYQNQGYYSSNQTHMISNSFHPLMSNYPQAAMINSAVTYSGANCPVASYNSFHTQPSGPGLISAGVPVPVQIETGHQYQNGSDAAYKWCN